MTEQIWMVRPTSIFFASVEPPMQRCLSSGHIRNTSSWHRSAADIESSIWSSQYRALRYRNGQRKTIEVWNESSSATVPAGALLRIQLTLRFYCIGPGDDWHTRQTQGHTEQRLALSS